MLQNNTEMLQEFEARKQLMHELYPNAKVEIEATVDLVYSDPHLCAVGHELFSIIAENQEMADNTRHDLISTLDC